MTVMYEIDFRAHWKFNVVSIFVFNVLCCSMYMKIIIQVGDSNWNANDVSFKSVLFPHNENAFEVLHMYTLSR